MKKYAAVFHSYAQLGDVVINFKSKSQNEVLEWMNEPGRHYFDRAVYKWDSKKRKWIPWKRNYDFPVEGFSPVKDGTSIQEFWGYRE